jgi:hypothetical protein
LVTASPTFEVAAEGEMRADQVLAAAEALEGADLVQALQDPAGLGGWRGNSRQSRATCFCLLESSFTTFLNEAWTNGICGRLPLNSSSIVRIWIFGTSP